MSRLIAILLLIALNLAVWTYEPPKGLSVTFIDVGQGDAILIETPNTQVLVDGGPGASVLTGLGEQLPFWDRTLDAVVATHPDADHIGGLSDVLERYTVSTIVEPGINNTTRAWGSFVDAANNEVLAGAGHTVASSGMRLNLGGGAYADILYPDHDVSEIDDTNSGSIVLHVVYGDTSFMLTGDAPTVVEQALFLQYGYGLDSDVLKAGHHGSRTSSSADFVESVSPRYAVFSRGCDNSYGHPHEEVIALFQSLTVQTFDTCNDGAVTFVSDGNSLRVVK
ncbi:MAG: ComEC/Rec2 family competence protein [Patescibacteria group bacterium]